MKLRSALALLGTGVLYLGRAVAQPPAAAPPPAAPGAPPACKTWGAGARCCDAAVAAHLAKAAVYSSCGESDATFLGEQGSRDTCKYFFHVEGQKDEDMFVQVYAPAQKEVPAQPNDPFFKWGKVGPVFYTEKALSPKSAPMLANSTGLWLPAKGYFVAINASTKVCTKAEAKRLAAHLK
jgi:hypothetical protein